jgi:hypothetical protein
MFGIAAASRRKRGTNFANCLTELMADEGVPEDVVRLRDCIAEELNVQLNMLRHPIDFGDVDRVAYWLAVQLDYAYRLEWAPRAEGRDDAE